MSNKLYHEFFRKAMATMRKGEESWVRYGPKEHSNTYFKLKHFVAKSEEEKNAVSDQIFIKFSVVNITRNPVQDDKSTYELRKQYYETVRAICKKLFAEKEYVNARDLYKRVLADFENMPKPMREGLSDVHRDDRTSILATLNNNIALCFFNLGNFGEALKFASTAVTKDPSNSKAHFLKYRSNKEKGDLDSANESIKEAIKLEPSNLQFRNEYTLFIEMKLKKEKAWRSKMEGFLHTDKFKKIEKDDEEEQKIRGKVWTKMERESKIEEQEQEINEKEISDYI